MNLQETIAAFLVANPDATADEVHVHVTGLEVSEIIKTNTQEAKTGIATVDLLNNTLDRLEVYVAPPELDPALHEAAEDVARKLTRTFNMLFSPEFYINLNVTEVKGAFDAALFLGVLTQVEYDGIMAAVTATSKPFGSTTIEQVKAAINPPVKTICTHLDGSQTFIPSISNRDVFTFIIDAAEPVSRIKLNLLWRENGTSPWVTHEIGSLSGGEGLFSRTLTRPNGLSAARLFEFSFTAEYEGQLNSVTVNLG